MSRAKQTGDRPKSIGLGSAASVGIGGMVGAGIFAILGLAVQSTSGAAPLAFLIGGALAMITAHCYGKLSVAFPDKGGTVSYLDRAFGPTPLTGTLNVLLVLSYIVMVAFYASAFGRFAVSFFDGSDVWRHLFITAVIFALAIVNVAGTGLVVRYGNFANSLKMLLLIGFVAVGFAVGDIEFERFAPSEWVGPVPLVAGAMVIFLNYEGFEMIANISSDVDESRRAHIMPRAFMGSVALVIVLYVLISVVVVGLLPAQDISDAGEFALAVAAEDLVGSIGFTIIAGAALLATSSAINATLFSTARITFTLAHEREIPSQLGLLVREQPIPALGFICVSATVLANFAPIETIAAMGSGGFLLTFTAVNVASIKLGGTIGVQRWIPALGSVACLGAVVVGASQMKLLDVMLFIGMVTIAIAIEVFARLQGRGITMLHRAHGTD